MPTVRTEALRRLREARGWGQEALAAKSITSLKTVSSIENGGNARLSTIAKLARALGVEPGELIEGHEAELPPSATAGSPAGKRVELKLTLSIPFENFDETEGLEQLMALISRLIDARNAITVTELSPGSIQLTLLLSDLDADALLLAYAEGRLAEIPITSMELLDADHVPPSNLPRVLTPQALANWRYRQKQQLLGDLKQTRNEDLKPARPDAEDGDEA